MTEVEEPVSLQKTLQPLMTYIECERHLTLRLPPHKYKSTHASDLGL